MGKENQEAGSFGAVGWQERKLASAERRRLPVVDLCYPLM